jgi:hypothetical protein
MRIVPKFKKTVKIPKEFSKYLWDHPTKSAPLEKLIVRVLKYGNFEEIKKIYLAYREEVYDVIQRYPDIKRGVRFWIKRWHLSKT